LATPASTSSTIIGRRVREDTCPRFCDSSSWLLQHGTRQLTEVCDRQTTTGAKRRRTSRQRHAQLQPWTVTDSTYRLALARCGRWLDRVRYKLGVNSPPMSPQQSPVRNLVDCCVPVSDIASRQRLRSAEASQVCQNHSTLANHQW